MSRALQLARAGQFQNAIIDDAATLKVWLAARKRRPLPCIPDPTVDEQRVLEALHEVDAALSQLQERIAQALGAVSSYRLSTSYTLEGEETQGVA